MKAVRSRETTGLKFATSLVRTVCEVSGSKTMIEDAREALGKAGILAAIKNRRSEILFEWMLRALSYQGVSDAAAATYMAQHGFAKARAVGEGLKAPVGCDKLLSFWHFTGCGYRKVASSCSRPGLLAACPLPRHDLRNGGLNQAAYSLFLFIRDVAGGDLVSWLDDRLEIADRSRGRNRGVRLCAAVVTPLSNVHGISFKVISMTLASLLLAGGQERERWMTAGASMVAIDTLVHNWLHRTGILKAMRAEHPYGPACYQDNGCEPVIRAVAARIDAKKFNPAFPMRFPRFVQHAIWRFCAQQEFNQCNGNKIDDSRRCKQADCILYDRCGRIRLNKVVVIPKAA